MMISHRFRRLASKNCLNFDSKEDKRGAKFRVSVLKEFIMNCATEKRLSQRNEEEKKDHENGIKPLLLVPKKEDSIKELYYFWDKKFLSAVASCQGSKGKNNVLINYKNDLVNEEYLSVKNIIKETNGSTLNERDELVKIKKNWAYALQVARRWFNEYCKGEVVTAASVLKSKNTRKDKTVESKKVENTLSFVVNCLLPLEKNKEATKNVANQKEGTNFVFVQGILIFFYLFLVIYIVC